MSKFKHKQMKTLFDSYTDIFSKHAMDIGKTCLVQVILKTKADIKPLNQKHTLCHYDMLG